MGDRAGPQLQQARGRHHVHRPVRGRQGGCHTCPTCHVSRLMSRVTEHESRGVRGADGAGGGEDSRGELPVRPLPLPGHAAADEGGSGGCRSPSPCPVTCISCLVSSGLSPHLMAQPLGYRTPDVGRFGWVTLPEFPYGELGWCNDATGHWKPFPYDDR